MAWSTSAPSLPSGQSWGNTVNVASNMNWYKLAGTLQSARGYGDTYYLKLTVTYSSGPNGYVVPTLYLLPGGTNAGSSPSGGGTKTWYYTGSGTGTATAGLSEYSTYFNSGAAYGAVTIPAKLTYAITYNGNGADGGSTAAQTHTSGTPTAISANGFTRTGYTFTGWNTAANGSGTAYAPGYGYNANAALTLYAQWKQAFIPAYVNDDGTVKQVEKAYIRDGDTVKEAVIYINDGSAVRALV